MSVTLDFEAPDIETAAEWGRENLEIRADGLSFLLQNQVDVGEVSCREIVGPNEEGRLIQWVQHLGFRLPNVDPVALSTVMGGSPFLFLSTRKLGSLRWFRKAQGTSAPEDAFLFLWISLEMLSAEFQTAEERFMTCPRCDEPFPSCPSCNNSTGVPAQASGQIEALLKEELGLSRKTFKQILATRAKLIHGNKPISGSFRSELADASEAVAEILIRSLANALQLNREWLPLRPYQPYGAKLDLRFIQEG